MYVCVCVFCCVAVEKAEEAKRQHEAAIAELSHSSVSTLTPHTHTHTHTHTHNTQVGALQEQLTQMKAD